MLYLHLQIQKLIKEKELKSLLNPEIALEEKQKGNKLFTEGEVLRYSTCSYYFSTRL